MYFCVSLQGDQSHLQFNTKIEHILGIFLTFTVKIVFILYSLPELQSAKTKLGVAERTLISSD